MFLRSMYPDDTRSPFARAVCGAAGFRKAAYGVSRKLVQ